MIWIAGADGQLGHELFHKLHETGNAIFTTINDCDITNDEEVRTFIKNNEISIIVNCAAYTAVDKAETDSKLAFQVNVDGPMILAKAAKDHDLIVIHISTDYVYDGQKNTPYTEDDITNPMSVYGASKLDGELSLQKYAPKSIILRTAWLYSKYGNNFVKSILKKARSNEHAIDPAEIKVVVDQIGTPTFAEDLAAVIIKIIGRIKDNNKNAEEKNLFHRDNFHIIYHFSNEGVASWYDFAKAIIEIAKLKSVVKPIMTQDYPTAAKRPSYSVLNKNKIKKDLNIEIPYWRESLEKCLKENQF